MTAQAVPTVSTSASSTYRRYVVWLLFAIAVMNYFDRQIVNILAEHIKRDLDLADWQLGALTGLAFASLYILLGVPVALLADRSSRSRIITISLAFWSIFTAVCGLAQNFTSLLLARLAVGVGEAGCQPPSHALISAYTAPAERSKAMGVYALGVPVGSLLALAAGGILAEQVGWRTAFFIAGAPGLALALLAAFTLRDPAKSAAASAGRAARSVRATLVELRGNAAFWWLSLGAAAMAFVSYGQLAFFGSFFLRVHRAGLADLAAQASDVSGATLGPTAIVGIGLGLIVGIAGILGAWLGGVLGDRLARRSPTALMWIPAIAAPMCLPFYVMAFLTPSTPAALFFLFLPKLIGGVWLAPTFAALQSVVAPDTRATASALHSSVVLLFGLGLGPIGIGALSDALSHAGLGEADGVRWALIGASCMCALAAVFFTIAARRMAGAKLS